MNTTWLRGAPRSAGLAVMLMAATVVGSPGLSQGQDFPGDLMRGPGEVVTPRDPAATPRTFGTGSSVAYTMQAWAFEAQRSVDTFDFNIGRALLGIGLMRATTNGSPMFAPLHLPAGAVVTRIELEGCDDSNTGEIMFGLFQGASPPTNIGDVTLFPAPSFPTTGVGATPGCALFSSTLPTPMTIDNANNYYLASVQTTQPPGLTDFSALRVFYNLQISPAPAAATFGDVPTSHPQFQFIQALVAAGVTAGCSVSPPLYCPDDPVTRRQMAVFISRALGLHFAP